MYSIGGGNEDRLTQDESGTVAVAAELAYVPVYLIVSIEDLASIVPLGSESARVVVNGIEAELAPIVSVVK